MAVWLRSGKKLSDISWFMYGMTIFLFFIAAGNTLHTCSTTTTARQSTTLQWVLEQSGSHPCMHPRSPEE